MSKETAPNSDRGFRVEVCDSRIDAADSRRWLVQESCTTAQAAAERASALRQQHSSNEISVAYQTEGHDAFGPSRRWVHLIVQSMPPELRPPAGSPPPVLTNRRRVMWSYCPELPESFSDVKAQHVIEQLEADLDRLVGTGTPCLIVDRLRHRTVDRDNACVNLSGLISANREPLVEGDLVQLRGDETRLVLVYGSYTDTSSHFGGIGWHFRYLEGEYASEFHSSPAGMYVEAISICGHISPQKMPTSPALRLQGQRYELAPGLHEGRRVTFPLSGTAHDRAGILCFGLYRGFGYGSRETSGVVWYVKFDDGHTEPVQYVEDVRPLS